MGYLKKRLQDILNKTVRIVHRNLRLTADNTGRSTAKSNGFVARYTQCYNIAPTDLRSLVNKSRRNCKVQARHEALLLDETSHLVTICLWGGRDVWIHLSL